VKPRCTTRTYLINSFESGLKSLKDGQFGDSQTIHEMASRGLQDAMTSFRRARPSEPRD